MKNNANLQVLYNNEFLIQTKFEKLGLMLVCPTFNIVKDYYAKSYSYNTDKNYCLVSLKPIDNAIKHINYMPDGITMQNVGGNCLKNEYNAIIVLCYEIANRFKNYLNAYDMEYRLSSFKAILESLPNELFKTMPGFTHELKDVMQKFLQNYLKNINPKSISLDDYKKECSMHLEIYNIINEVYENKTKTKKLVNKK